MTNANVYAEFASRWPGPGAPAIIAGGETLSYGALAREAGRMANALAAAGVRPGDRVCVQVEKSAAFVALFLGALRAGAVINPLNSAYSAAELAYFVADCTPALMVLDPARAAAVAHANILTLDAAGGGSLAELAAAQSPDAPVVPRSAGDLAALIYTSGTTGRAKGAMITHGNLASNIAALHRAWAFQPGDVLLHALPVFHVHGLFVALGTALWGGHAVLWHSRFDARAVLADLPRASVMMGVPTFYTRLLAEPGLADAARQMRLFVSGSAPLLAETHRDFAAVTGHAILERYGMTETGMIASNPYDGARLPGTVGYPLDCEVRLDGEAGAPGIIEVRGPNVFAGYWGLPEKTAQEFHDGWFVTGDIGTIAPDGRIAIVGRAKDLIISGGLNIYPKEVEDALDAIPGVAESAVIGVPHADFGEGVVAVVVAGDGCLDEAGLIAALAGLARYKQPKRVVFAASLPRNAMGKVQKAELRALHGALLLAARAAG